MADSPVESRPSNATAGTNGLAHANWLALTAGFANSQLFALTAFFGAIAAAVASFQKLRESLQISIWQCGVLVLALLIILFFAHTLPALRDKWRKNRLGQITGSTKPGYFQLAPREDEETFKRADGKHDEVLKWLRQPQRRVLYLTGSSGAGKSSMLAAWVLPKLEREGVKVIRLRGYQDPARALEEELKRPGVVWKRSSPPITGLSQLFERACERALPTRILVVFDQFEEFLILQEKGPQRAKFVEFLIAQAGLRAVGSTILLVFRAEYDGFIANLNLPAPMYGRNLQKVSAFTQRDAQNFLTASGLKIQEQLLAEVLREAAEVEQTRGLIRPVTLNLCGLVLSRFATGLPHSFRPGRLIRGFVHEAIFQRGVGDASPILLRKLISDQVTNRPSSIDQLAKGTRLTPRQAQGAMFKLGDPERGIVRALDPDYRIWEIAHDFLVPMIDSILARWNVPPWRRVRPWLPVVYLATVLAVFAYGSRPPYSDLDPIAQLSSLGWTKVLVKARAPRDAPPLDVFPGLGGIKYYLLSFENWVPPLKSQRALSRVPDPFVVTLDNVPSFDSVRVGDWSGLSNLRAMSISGSGSGRFDISAARSLPKSLTWLSIYNSWVTNDEIQDLPRSLTRLDLSNDDLLTDVGLKDLPKSLTSLNISGDDQITNKGLKFLPKSLTSLNISLDDGITDEGLKSLPLTVHVTR